MVMLCNEIAQAVGLTHRCNPRKCQARGSKNPNKVFSTKNEQHHGFITLLYQKMSGNILPSGRLSRSIIVDIESKFGDKFECCRKLQRLIGTDVDRKRKSNLITSNENEQKKKKRDALTATQEVSTENNNISDNNCTQQVHVVDIERERASINT